MRPLWVVGAALLAVCVGKEVRAGSPAASRDTGASRAAHMPRDTGTTPEGPAPCAPKQRRPKVRVVLDGKVNLNTADAQLLNMLPGVGMASAERIIARRERRPFRRPEELVRVKGFGARRFQRVRPYVSVEGPSTLRPVWTGLASPDPDPPEPEPGNEPGA